MKDGSFENYCNCGGYAWTMNGRPESQPHMGWCPQYGEYEKWYADKKLPDTSPYAASSESK